jgi:SagB-type dehydrogenase family enzyme
MENDPQVKVRCPIGMNLTGSPSGTAFCDASTQGRWDVETFGPHLVRLLQFCADPRAVPEVVAMLADAAHCDRRVAERSVSALLEAGMLVREDEHPCMPERAALRRWERMGWREAFFFHARTNLLPKTDYSHPEAYREDAGTMRRKVAAEPDLPSNYKDYPDATTISLEGARTDFADEPPLAAILSEESRPAGDRPLGLEELGWFIHLAYGQTANRRLPVTGAHVGKTSPSGGSRHPTEVYPVILDVDGVDPGLYHYSVRRNCLELLQPGDLSAQMREHVFLSSERPPFRPRVVFLYSTIFERSMFRYREPRSYRVMHFDIGHLVQTSAYLASALRRPCYRAYAMHDSAVDRLLGIDGISEASMAFMVLG